MIRSGLFAILGLLLLSPMSFAQPAAPLYEECRLDSIYPSGGQRGTTVKLELRGYGNGFAMPRDLIIDGPSGIQLKEIKHVSGILATATLEIAPHAPLGRRWLRVATERSGLTNFAYFVVGDLAEQRDAEPNNTLEKAQSVQLPVVINGRVDPAADLDVYRFSGKQGQKLVAAIAAHALDVHGQGKTYGIADFSLEVLDANGRTLRVAEDSWGFDPVIELTLPQDGDYLVRVQLLNYQGFPEAVYRLTLGEVPYPEGVFPAGFRRGTATAIAYFGPNVPRGSKQIIGNRLMDGASDSDPAWTGAEGSLWDPAYPLRHVTLNHGASSGLDVPVIIGDLPETVEAEPNDARPQAGSMAVASTVNSRFDQAQDTDWYQVRLDANQKVAFEIHAQRFIRSPVDTLLQVFDAQGKLVGENDDEVFEPGYECYHDFKTTDSKLAMTAPAAGAYFVKVTEQSGMGGARAIYRLTVKNDEPDFRLTHFPDAIPIWGPGSTACVLVRIDRFGGCNDEIEVQVEGLPAGWSSSAATSLPTTPDRPYSTYQLKVFLTITAPLDAPVGTCLPLRIIGRAKRANGQVLERGSIPLNLFYTSDTGFFRPSPVSRVAVAKSQGPWLGTVSQEITIPQGGSGNLIVQAFGSSDLQQLPLVVNLATAGVACGLTTPQNLPITDGRVEVPLKLPPELYPGTYGITVAQTWRSDIRIGMPGPCTPLIKLHVVPAK